MSLQLIVMGVPFMQKAFKLQMLDARGWLYVFILGLVPLLANELLKWMGRAGKQRGKVKQEKSQ